MNRRVMRRVGVGELAGESEDEVVVDDDSDVDELVEVDVDEEEEVSGTTTVAKYDAMVTWNVQMPPVTTHVAGRTIPSLVHPEVPVAERTMLKV